MRLLLQVGQPYSLRWAPFLCFLQNESCALTSGLQLFFLAAVFLTCSLLWCISINPISIVQSNHPLYTMSQSDYELIALVWKCTNWQQAGKLQSQLFPTLGNEDVCPTATISLDLLKRICLSLIS